MTVTLVTIEGVELVSTGTYRLASGETTFSQEHLADAVAASQDPTVPAPRIKLGHTDPRFDEAVASGELDGEPAFGTVQNMRLSDDGQTIIGDLVDVPSWLGDVLASAYPGRSIEGGFNYTAPSGRQYSLAVDALALLGVTWPGVGSLADLREILEQNGTVQTDGLVEASSEQFVVARISRPGDGRPAPSTQQLLAGMDLGSVRMQFCGDLDTGEVPRVPDTQPQADDVGPQLWWWPRSVRVEDDGTLCLIVDDEQGHLIRIPFTVQQADLVYGDPELVIETYVPVTADPDDGVAARAHGPRVLASWPVRAASRPSTTTEVTTMDVDAAVLRTRLGLPEDADEAAIQEALNTESEQTTTTETTAAATVPDGMVLVDEETLQQIRRGAEQGEQVAARLAQQDRDQVILAAINEGRFPVSRREHYQQAWERDPEGTRTLLTASVADGGLAPGLVPVGGQEIGRGGEGDPDAASADADHEAFMARQFPNEHARLTGSDRRLRVRQEA